MYLTAHPRRPCIQKASAQSDAKELPELAELSPDASSSSPKVTVSPQGEVTMVEDRPAQSIMIIMGNLEN